MSCEVRHRDHAGKPMLRLSAILTHTCSKEAIVGCLEVRAASVFEPCAIPKSAAFDTRRRAIRLRQRRPLRRGSG